jgi:hypothetical protein
VRGASRLVEAVTDQGKLILAATRPSFDSIERIVAQKAVRVKPANLPKRAVPTSAPNDR